MPSNSPLPRFFSVKDIAAQLRVSTKTVRRWIDAGDLSVHRVGRLLRISDADLTTFTRTRREG